MKNDLKFRSIVIDGKFYRVQRYPVEEIREGNFDVLQRGVAYHVVDDLCDNLVFPYRGDDKTLREVRSPKCPVGIYKVRVKKDVWRVAFSRPKDKREREEYLIDNVKDIAAAVRAGEYTKEQFADVDLELAIGGESFLPPLRPTDDLMNRIVKTGIRLKDVPYAPYGKRIESTAAIKGKGSNEPRNMRNNARRCIMQNNAMSSSKARQYTEAFDLEFAIILKDREGAPNPMFTGDSQLVIYSHMPFDIDQNKLIRVDEVLEGQLGSKITGEELAEDYIVEEFIDEDEEE